MSTFPNAKSSRPGAALETQALLTAASRGLTDTRWSPPCQLRICSASGARSGGKVIRRFWAGNMQLIRCWALSDNMTDNGGGSYPNTVTLQCSSPMPSSEKPILYMKIHVKLPVRQCAEKILSTFPKGQCIGNISRQQVAIPCHTTPMGTLTLLSDKHRRCSLPSVRPSRVVLAGW